MQISCPACRYTDVLFELKKKAEKISELAEYQKTYALFSKSGYTNRLRELAVQSADIVLIDKEHVL